MVTAVKGASAQLPATEIVFIRFAFGLTAVAIPVWRILRRDGLHSPKLLLIRGILGGSAVLAYFAAIGMIPAAMASLLNYTSPLYTTLLGIWFLKERPQPSVLGFGLLAMLGCMAIAFGGWQQASGSLIGYALAALSAVGAGSSIVAMRALGRSDHPVLTFSALCLCGILVSLPFGLSPGETSWRWPAGSTLWWLAAMSLTSLVAQLLFTFGLRYVSASTAALSMQLSVGFTALLSYVAFGEQPTAVQLVGALLILAGVIGIVMAALQADKIKGQKAV